MRNKELMLRRIQTLEGKLKTLDLHIHRGGNNEQIMNAQKDIQELVDDLKAIIEREQ
jgi:hypothetical protein|tara:strand:- start:297 stop:467 length:171 start_codon:yes stop_codon:yes gene_type:complete